MDSPTTENHTNVKYAGFWIRVGAYSVDMVILLIPSLLISFLYRAAFPASNELEQMLVDLFDSGLSLMVWWVYCSVLHSSEWQATLGKKALGLKVIDKQGGRISFGQATGRYFAGILSALLLGIGYMMAGWTGRKQALHDKLAETFVIRASEN